MTQPFRFSPKLASGHTATVFGATGFLGRYIVNRLGKITKIKGNPSNVSKPAPDVPWSFRIARR
jgi:hypothetical protein